MKYYAVEFEFNHPEMYENPTIRPVVHATENVLKLVLGLTPICEDSDLSIVSVRPATEDEIAEYQAEEASQYIEEEEYDDTEYEEFWKGLIDDVE
jgi:hypothetical protein